MDHPTPIALEFSLITSSLTGTLNCLMVPESAPVVQYELTMAVY